MTKRMLATIASQLFFRQPLRRGYAANLSTEIKTEAFRSGAETGIGGDHLADTRRSDGSEMETVERAERERRRMATARDEHLMRRAFHILTPRDFKKMSLAAMFLERSEKKFCLTLRDLPPLLFCRQGIKQLDTMEKTDRHLFFLPAEHLPVMI